MLMITWRSSLYPMDFYYFHNVDNMEDREDCHNVDAHLEKELVSRFKKVRLDERGAALDQAQHVNFLAMIRIIMILMIIMGIIGRKNVMIAQVIEA